MCVFSVCEELQKKHTKKKQLIIRTKVTTVTTSAHQEGVNVFPPINQLEAFFQLLLSTCKVNLVPHELHLSQVVILE